jgi:hypothetical protein
MSIETLIVFWIIWLVIALIIGQHKNIDLTTTLVLGGLLGLIGVVILLCMKPGLPKAPAGMYAVKCARCSAGQNIPFGQAEFQCWQCKTSQHIIKGVLS